MVNGFDTVTRDEGDIANTYEYMFDINTGTHDVPEWLNVPELTALNPAHPPKSKDATVYADQGTTSMRKTGSDFTLDFNLLKKRNATTGDFQESWQVLKTAADAKGDANNVEVRYYDSRGASDAYQGLVSVSRGTRPSTANDDPGYDNFAFASVGPVVPIDNPLATPAAPVAPVIASVTPASAAAGIMVTIVLSAGASTVSPSAADSVKFGADNAGVGKFAIVGNTIVAEVPAGTAGAANITVKNPTGTSSAATFSRTA